MHTICFYLNPFYNWLVRLANYRDRAHYMLYYRVRIQQDSEKEAHKSSMKKSFYHLLHFNCSECDMRGQSVGRKQEQSGRSGYLY